jgi:caffeoyl-CoA O-methyltransferase
VHITDPEIERYAVEHTTPEPAWFAEVASRTRDASPWAGMMVGTLEGRFLKMLVALVRPAVVLEIGTFTGYSSLSMAEALPPHGRIITCDVSEEHAALAREHFALSPHTGRIEVRVGPALDTIAALDGPFDLVFIDADKASYRAYLEAVLPKLSDDGLIAVDNVLWRGQVLDPSVDDADTVAIRAFNDSVAADERLEAVMVPIRDGVTLIKKRDR